MKLLAKNRRATFDYDISEHIIAGISLTGSEVKSIKAGHASLKGSFVTLRENEVFLNNANVTPYAHAAKDTRVDPTRPRKLLLHRRQIDKLIGERQAGQSLVATAVLLERNLVKVEIGIGKSRKRYDKREVIKQRDINRELSRKINR